MRIFLPRRWEQATPHPGKYHLTNLMSALLNTSDKICSSPDFRSDKSAKPTGHGHAHASGCVRTESRDETNPQANINKQILPQLSRLGDGLTNIEKVQQ